MRLHPGTTLGPYSVTAKIGDERDDRGLIRRRNLS